MTNTGATIRRTGLASAMTVALVALVGCEDESPIGSSDAMSELGEAVLSLEASDLEAAAGSRISLALRAEAGETNVGAVQGYLRFDPAELRYVGEVAEDADIVVVNDKLAEEGELRFASLNPYGIEDVRAAVFGFEVLRSEYADALRFESEAVVHLESNEPLQHRVSDVVGQGSGMPSASEARMASEEELLVRIDPRLASREGPDFIISPPPPVAGGGPMLYGDATMNGTIDSFDALDVTRVAVGITPLISGSGTLDDGLQPADRDRITAANVAPANTDEPPPCRPGWQGCDPNNRVLDSFDALPITRFAVGASVPVVGTEIPLADIAIHGGSTYGSADTVFVPEGTLTGTIEWTSDHLYILEGVVAVGNEDGAAGTLNIEAGTRVEGDELSALFITRNGQIFAEGTASAPIVFTCSTRNSMGDRFPSCWGGIFIAGNAVINEAETGQGPAPAIPGRNPGGGGNQRVGEGGAVNFGGNNDADSSGTMRYVSIRYGGRILTANNELNNLTVGACGSGTVLEHIQVHAGTDDGMEIFGGRCNVKYLYATANEDDQFDYSFGYDGDVQFIIIQGDPSDAEAFDRGFEVDNTETAATYNNMPRTNATIYNVTYVGNGDVAESGPVMQYRRGAGSTLRNVVAVGAQTGIEVDDAQSCALLGEALTFEKFVLLDVGQTVGGSGDGCSDAQVTASLVDVANRAYSDDLIDPFAKRLPDFRPSSPGGVSASFSPASTPGGFFSPGSFFGAVEPGASLIPWYAGWVTGWQSSSVR